MDKKLDTIPCLKEFHKIVEKQLNQGYPKKIHSNYYTSEFVQDITFLYPNYPKQVYKNHCITSRDKEYIIRIVLNDKFKKAYLNDVEFIEKSFTFKNPETQAIFRPSP